MLLQCLFLTTIFHMSHRPILNKNYGRKAYNILEWNQLIITPSSIEKINSLFLFNLNLLTSLSHSPASLNWLKEIIKRLRFNRFKVWKGYLSCIIIHTVTFFLNVPV